MRERQLIDAVNRGVPRTIHRQSMTGAAMNLNGIPDYYYDGPTGDLWVEYKQLKSMPRSGVVVGALTELQIHWLERRYRNSLAHRPNASVVVGLPNRTAVIQRTPTEWRTGTPVTSAVSLKEVSAWIDEFCSLHSGS